MISFKLSDVDNSVEIYWRDKLIGYVAQPCEDDENPNAPDIFIDVAHDTVDPRVPQPPLGLTATMETMGPYPSLHVRFTEPGPQVADMEPKTRQGR